ncbi:MAG: ABC transporter substrate-binding protein [Halothece sp.]
MLRFLLRSLTLLLLFFTLTACHNTPINNITTVTLSGWQSSLEEKQLLEQVLKDFETIHPNIHVKFETITDQYMDVIKTRLIGNAAPDIFYLDTLEAPLLMSSGVLEPLNNYISPEFDLADFKPELLEAFKYKNTLYGLPKDFSTLSLYYNKRAFEKAQLTHPPKTWKELREYAQRLTLDTDSDGRPEQYGFGLSPELARLAFLIKAYGGKLINSQGNAAFATSRSLKGLESLTNFYQIDRTAATPSDVGTSSSSEMLGQGKTAMVLDGSWGIPYLQKTFPNLEFGMAEIPTENGKYGTMIYTVAYGMNAQSIHKEAAWEVISYLTGKEGMKAWAKGGLVLPTRQSVLAELGYEDNPLYRPFLRGSRYATLWQGHENLPTIITHFNNQFLSVLLGEQSLKMAMKKAEETANKEIQAVNY